MLEAFRKTFHLVGRDKRNRWVALVAGAVVVSVLEMFGAVLIYLLLTLLVEPTATLPMPLLGDLRELGAGIDGTTFFLISAAVLGGFFLIRALAQLAYIYVKNRLAHNAGARLSTKLMRGYLRLPYAFHLRRSSAELVRNAQQSVEQLASQCFLSVIQVIAEVLLIVGLVTVMLLVAPAATGLAALIVGSAALLLMVVVQPRLKRLGLRAQEMRQRTLASLQQSLHGIREIKVLGTEEHFAEGYQADRDTLARSVHLSGTVAEMPRLVIETALIAFILILFSVSIAAGAATEELLSTLGLFAYAGLRIQPSLQKLVSGLNKVKYSAAAIDDVYADLVLVEKLDAEDEQPNDLGFREELWLESASFAYEGADHPAVIDAELSIQPGDVIGICGPTGGGKTTLTDLIIGVLDPTEGRITVDGVDLRHRRAAWFRKLGIVPQMVFLIDDTVRRNIAFGIPDEDIDVDALEEAIELAQLTEFVGRLPDGLDTVVGERGVRVSGGQRQRIAIARALYRKPEVLVFDEGTSALDNFTESALISSLERLRGERTIILVAHRLSTVRNCDRIVYLEDGRIAGIGSFEYLQRHSEGFQALSRDG